MATADTGRDRFLKANLIFFKTTDAIRPFIDEGYIALQA